MPAKGGAYEPDEQFQTPCRRPTSTRWGARLLIAQPCCVPPSLLMHIRVDARLESKE